MPFEFKGIEKYASNNITVNATNYTEKKQTLQTKKTYQRIYFMRTGDTLKKRDITANQQREMNFWNIIM